MLCNRLAKFRLTPTSTYDDYTFYTYDHRQRLVAVTFRDGPSTSDDVVQQVEYDYDALNRRVSRTHSIPGVSYLRELYAYDGHDILLEQHQTSPSSFAYFTFAHFWLPGGEQSLLLSVSVRSSAAFASLASWSCCWFSFSGDPRWRSNNGIWRRRLIGGACFSNLPRVG